MTQTSDGGPSASEIEEKAIKLFLTRNGSFGGEWSRTQEKDEWRRLAREEIERLRGVPLLPP